MFFTLRVHGQPFHLNLLNSQEKGLSFQAAGALQAPSPLCDPWISEFAIQHSCVARECIPRERLSTNGPVGKGSSQCEEDEGGGPSCKTVPQQWHRVANCC